MLRSIHGCLEILRETLITAWSVISGTIKRKGGIGGLNTLAVTLIMIFISYHATLERALQRSDIFWEELLQVYGDVTA